MDPATYEDLRNRTLLFFIEKLLDPSHNSSSSNTNNNSTSSSGGGNQGNNNNNSGSSSNTTSSNNNNKNNNNNNNNNNGNNSLVLYTNKRTLHDLSCQFGSKGFTKEMRQIAGNSQSGLKKFLQTYPSIFKIEGDIVSYNVNSSLVKSVVGCGDGDYGEQGGGGDSNVGTGGGNGNDPLRRQSSSGGGGGGPSLGIDSEAVEYFRDRLIQYGLGIWVPVKSLLGHRSQAPPHIRHVSGQHIREFTQFLSKYPTVFILNPSQEEVLLKEFENYLNDHLQNQSSTSITGTAGGGAAGSRLIDKRRIVELIEFFATCISERGPMLCEQLFCAGNSKFEGAEDAVAECFKTPGDLQTFFKMYPQCFQVHSNLVTFSDSYKVGLEYLKRQSGVVIHHGVVSSSSTTPSSGPVPLSSIILPPAAARNPSSSIKTAQKDKTTTSTIATTTVTSSPSSSSLTTNSNSPQQASVTTASTTTTTTPATAPKSLLKQRVSKILLQTIQSNTEHDYREHHQLISSPTRTTVGAGGGTGILSSRKPTDQHSSSSIMSTLQQQQQQHVSQFSQLCESGDTDELRAYILSRTTIVSNQRKAGQIIEEIIRANEPVSLDFEGINLGNDGQITLVQVGTARGSVFIFDVLTQPGLIEAGEKSLLGRLLCGGGGSGGGENEQDNNKVATATPGSGVVKVMHDCRNDSVNLYRQFGIRLRNVFDTQVAHICVQMTGEDQSQQQQKNERDKQTTTTPEVDGGGGGDHPHHHHNRKPPNSKNISLNNLCAVYGTVCNPFKDKVKSVYRHDQKYWSRRPLTKQMIAYASCDVLVLVPSIHAALKSRVEADPERLRLFNELCEEQILTHIHPEEIRSRRRLRKNEADLRALREKLDRALGVVSGSATATGQGGDGGGVSTTIVSNSSLVLSNREMRLLKHLNLTEEEKEKLKLSLKVAKKLEKMSGGGSLHHHQSSSCSPRPDSNDVGLGGATLSSDSTSNSELTSLEYTEASLSSLPPAAVPPPFHDARMAQIDSLEAIINRLISEQEEEVVEGEDGVMAMVDEEEDDDGGGDDDEVTAHKQQHPQRGPEFLLGRYGANRVNASTQTLSTGDVVMLQIFDD